MNLKKLANAKRVKVTYLQQMDIDNTFVKNFRQKNNLTQNNLAIILGVKKKTIEKWEQGKNKVGGSSAILLTLFELKPEVLKMCYSSEVISASAKDTEFTKISSTTYTEKTSYQSSNQSIKYFDTVLYGI